MTVRGSDRKRTLKGGSALKLLDLRLFEDGGERGSALGADLVLRDTDRNRKAVKIELSQRAMNIASQQLSEAIHMLMGEAHPAQIEMGALEIDWIRWYQSLASTTESAYECLPGV